MHGSLLPFVRRRNLKRPAYASNRLDFLDFPMTRNGRIYIRDRVHADDVVTAMVIEMTSVLTQVFVVVATFHNSHFNDLGKELNLTIRDFRTDYVHFTKYGHTLLANAILDEIMPSGVYPKELVNAEKAFNTYNTPNMFLKQENLIHGMIKIEFNKNKKTFEITDTDIKEYIKKTETIHQTDRNNHKVVIYLNTSTVKSIVGNIPEPKSILSCGEGKKYLLKQENMEFNRISFNLTGSNNEPVTEAEMEKDSDELKFIIYF